MRKRIVSGVVVSLAMVLAFTASAQAVTYGDAISINLTYGADSLVSGAQAGAAGTNYGSWMNMTGGHGANWAASADGSGWTSGAFDSALTAGGIDLTLTPTIFRIDLYDGGWGLNSQWNDSANAANTLGRAGMSNGNMPNNWGPTNLTIDLGNIPTAFTTSGYEIWALGGATRNSGAGLAWTKISGSDPLTTADPAAFSINSLGWRSVAAVQVLKIVGTPILTAAPVNGTPIDFGHLPVSTASTTSTITLSNTGDDTTTINVTSGAFGDGSLFSFDPAFSIQTLIAGSATNSMDYFVKFNGSATAGIYNDTLTFLTDAGNLSYAVSATVDPQPPHPGDANSDGTVNFLDYNIVKTNYLSNGVGWDGGDLNDDGTVNFLDYNIVKTHYLHTNAANGTGVQAIPEPATLALLALAGLAIRRKRQG